jgi:hypothetical protein
MLPVREMAKNTPAFHVVWSAVRFLIKLNFKSKEILVHMFEKLSSYLHRRTMPLWGSSLAIAIPLSRKFNSRYFIIVLPCFKKLINADVSSFQLNNKTAYQLARTTDTLQLSLYTKARFLEGYSCSQRLCQIGIYEWREDDDDD